MDRPGVDSARSKVQTFLDSTAAQINPGAASNLSFASLDVSSPNARRLRTFGDAHKQNFQTQRHVGGGSSMQGFVAVVASFVMPSHTGSEATQLILRWFHIIAGITWVGLLYFFNLVNVPFMKQVDAGMKPKIFQYLTLPALNWFRWSSLVTVFLGFWYWSQFYVAPDAHREGTNAGAAIGSFCCSGSRYGPSCS